MNKFLKIGSFVVFLILGASLFIPITYEDCTPNTDQKAIADMSAINTALEMFYLDVGRYPTQEEGLEILSNTEKGSAITGYKKSGYLERQVKDPRTFFRKKSRSY
jgi:general secretion pathway protein G